MVISDGCIETCAGSNITSVGRASIVIATIGVLGTTISDGLVLTTPWTAGIRGTGIAVVTGNIIIGRHGRLVPILTDPLLTERRWHIDVGDRHIGTLAAARITTICGAEVIVVTIRVLLATIWYGCMLTPTIGVA